MIFLAQRNNKTGLTEQKPNTIKRSGLENTDRRNGW